MKDYSQNGEQALILKFFGDEIGRFLDLGANDGISGSNTYALNERGWSGVCIEACPKMFIRLRNTYGGNKRVDCVLAAVRSRRMFTPFYEYMPGLSSCDPEHAIPEVYDQFLVPTVTPDEIVESFGPQFDFVSVDIEGCDLEVLKVSQKLLHGTRLLCVEDSKPSGWRISYHHALHEVVNGLGFEKIIGTTSNPPAIGNTLYAR